jgi:pimeloyl-ACP methyl ester carboxylesterase
MTAAALPPGAVVVVLTSSSRPHGDVAHALEVARSRDATTVVIGGAMSSDALGGAKYMMTLPQGSSPELSSIVAAHTVAQAVRAVSHLVVDGPASPWVPWPHVRDLAIPFPGHDPIPATLLSQPSDRPSRSLVILLGGHRASRSQAVPPGILANRELPSHTAALLNAGHHVLVVENPGHGSRIREWEEPAGYVGASLSGQGEDVLELAWTQAPSVVDAVLALPEAIDARRIAVVGQSWGGLQAMLLASGDPRISCVAALMPVCFPNTVHEYRRMARKPRVQAANLLGERGDILSRRPLLLVSGELDHVAPAKEVRRLEEGLRPRYEQAGRGDHLVHVQLANVGHTFSRDATELMVEWVARHTAPVRPADGEVAR